MKISIIGKFQFLLDRLRMYFALLNTIMLFDLVAAVTGIQWYHIVVICTGIVFLFFDSKIAAPAHYQAVFDKNPRLVELLERVRNIEKNM